jgi:hypothetical protein
MTELAKRSTEELPDNSAVVDADNLLRQYSFEVCQDSIERLLDRWLRTYPASWVRLAIIEALYQGRYKAVSADHILAFWKRRGQPIYHFNHEFERLICNKIPRSLVPQTIPPTNGNAAVARSLEPVLPYPNIVIQLPGLKPTTATRNPVELVSLKVALTEEPAINLPAPPKFSRLTRLERHATRQVGAETGRSQPPVAEQRPSNQPAQAENGNSYPDPSTSSPPVAFAPQNPIHPSTPELNCPESHDKPQSVADPNAASISEPR